MWQNPLSMVVMMLALGPGVATASAISFDTFGVGNTYDTGFRYSIDGNRDFVAFGWVAAVSGRLYAITVAIGRSTTDTTATQFDLFQVNESVPGRSQIESFVVANSIAPGLTPGGIVTFGSSTRPLLKEGQSYWLGFSEPQTVDGSLSLWFFNDQGIFGTRTTSALPPHGAWLPAFRILVLQVPEPGTLALLGLGLAALGLSRRRRSI